jgi:hypothetical protein
VFFCLPPPPGTEPGISHLACGLSGNVGSWPPPAAPAACFAHFAEGEC